MEGRGLVGGVVEGEALVSRHFFGFTHGVIPQTGEISDIRHEWNGLNMKGKILVFPFGKSSASGAIWILETVRCGNAPLAIINVEAEPVIGVGCFLSGMLYGKPIVLVDRLDQNPCEVIKSRDYLRVNGDAGLAEILQRPAAGSR